MQLTVLMGMFFLYFALKAMEDNNNRTEPVITEEGHARIANIRQ